MDDGALPCKTNASKDDRYEIGLQHWQKDLSYFLGVEVLNYQDLQLSLIGKT